MPVYPGPGEGHLEPLAVGEELAEVVSVVQPDAESAEFRVQRAGLFRQPQ
jgi:hypothetical protein